MTAKFILFNLVFVFTLNTISCKQQNRKQELSDNNAVATDSLIALWNNAWNNHDSSALSKMFTENATVVFSDKNKITGVDSIMTKWVKENLPLVTNLKTEKLASSSNADMAYYAGNYSLDISGGDSTRSQDIGCFTSVWKLQNDNSWRIELMFFGVHAE